MNIQLITGNNKLKSDKNITVSDYSRPMALDNFDINVIDLSAEELWRNKSKIYGQLNQTDDLSSIAEVVKGTKNAKVIYAFPQDKEYKYYFRTGYTETEKIKNMLCSKNCKQYFLSCVPYDNLNLDVIFEVTNTTLDDKVFSADFHFKHDFGNAITQSDKSNKITTFMIFDNIYFTTLNICRSTDDLEHFIKVIFEKRNISKAPDWINNYCFGDDLEQKDIIKNNTDKIEELKNEIECAEEKLKQNNKYKSILYTNGQDLVDVVFEILEKLFDYKLSDFEDEKREDFLIQKEKCVFVGEIKGITTNVKNQYVSQLDVHCQSIIDDLNENQKEEDVHGLLIINPFRTKKLEEREPIHEKQISLAKRNKSLIIETVTLLKVFELFISDIITTEDVITVFANKTGLLNIDDFKK